MSFQDKVVWITGASSGIGEAVAYAFSKAGAKLVISARREEELNRVKNACEQPDKVMVLTMDLADHDSMAGKTTEVLQAIGQVDIMFHNAGISQRSLIMDTDFSVDRKMIEVNYLGTIALTKALLPSMLEKGHGHFAVVTSLTGYIGSPLRSGYAAAKHALHGYFDSLRAELEDKGIKVTLICPGYVATNVSVNALTGNGSKQNSMDEATANGLDTTTAANRMLKAIKNGQHEAYVGNKEIIAIYLKRFLPKVFAGIIKRTKVT